MIALIGNHLWQSTLFAAAVGLLALALRRNRPHVRYWLWVAASLKFLLPFAALAALGSRFEWHQEVAIAPPAVSAVIGVVSQPFAGVAFESIVPPAGPASAVADLPWARTLGTLAAIVWAVGSIATIVAWGRRWRRMAAAVRAAVPMADGREVETLRRLERIAGLARAIPLRLSAGRVEPGMFGILRPVLLWPRSISDRLSDAQVAAIMAHEIAHGSRHDNLWSALHMVVQAVFWFHPLVWWLSARLIDERERACDQDVLRLGSEPGVYAESILKTCQFYLESPLVCVAGVTGSDLKRRIEDIMHNRAGIALTTWKKILLATAGAATFAAPLLMGPLDAQVPAQPENPALVFETASVKPNRTGEMRVMMRNLPGGAYEATNVTVRAMLIQAFGVAEFQLVGAPAWVDSERYDILAKSPAGAVQAEFAQRYRNLILERFQVKSRRETRELPVYALVFAKADNKLGPKMLGSKSDCSPEGMAKMRESMNAGPVALAAAGGGPGRGGPMPMMPPMAPLGEPRVCTTMRNGGQTFAGGATMAEIARMLQTNTGRVVLDRTGLTGRYDFDLSFTPDPGLSGRGMGGGLPTDPSAPPRPVDPDAVTIFQATQDQLGLKLESTRGPVDVVVIDSMQRAAEN